VQIVRILFASTRGAGHFNPLVPFIEAALGGGHEVLVAAPPDLADTIEAAGFPHWLVDPPPEPLLGPTWGRVQASASVEEAERIVVAEIFGALNVQAALPAMRAARDEWGADLVLRDPAEYASAIAAEERGVPHWRVAIGLASSDRRMTEVASEGFEAGAPGAAEAIAKSPYLTMFPETLEEPGDAGPADTRRFRDAAAAAPGEPLGDHWPGDDRSLVYLSFGSVTGTLPSAPALYRAALEAAAGLDARVLVTIGRQLEPDALGEPPANVHLAQWIPQADAFAEASLVVCHGGSGTTLGALTAGLPLVVVPLFADQPPNAKRVAEVGAGLVVEPLRQLPSQALPTGIDPDALRSAMAAALEDDRLTSGARAIAAEMRGLPAADRAFPQS
jgi:UDP:flavonoid glycosyltransferase YjiC (YdhE family)